MSSISTIEVHKFGGASLKDAAGFRNVSKVIAGIRDSSGSKPVQLLLVVSALGKTTNALEELTTAFFAGKLDEAQVMLQSIRQKHLALLDELFINRNHPVYDDVSNCFTEIEWVLEDEPHPLFDFVYDQIVSAGEFLSSRILSSWLNKENIESHWADARDYLLTDNTYREAVVDMEKTRQNILEFLPPSLSRSIVVTQGFIGNTTENFNTTLGREGSDYSAAIFANCLDACSLTVWKDVPGMMNADPAEFAGAQVLSQLSYTEATELAYYGATVIHPKTLRPLQQKNIPLYVKSFLDTTQPGTMINELAGVPEFPSYIFKKSQLIISLQTPDFSFMLENHLSQIFRIFAGYRIHINMMENSALSFSAVIDEDRAGNNVSRLLKELSLLYAVRYNTGLTLLTIRNYLKDPETAYNFIVGKEVILESKSRHNIQFVYR